MKPNRNQDWQLKCSPPIYLASLCTDGSSKIICKKEKSHLLNSSFPREDCNMRVRLFDTCSPPLTHPKSTTDPSLISDCGNSGLTRPRVLGQSSYRCSLTNDRGLEGVRRGPRYGSIVSPPFTRQYPHQFNGQCPPSPSCSNQHSCQKLLFRGSRRKLLKNSRRVPGRQVGGA